MTPLKDSFQPSRNLPVA